VQYHDYSVKIFSNTTDLAGRVTERCRMHGWRKSTGEARNSWRNLDNR
jgi:hypothetical protein